MDPGNAPRSLTVLPYYRIIHKEEGMAKRGRPFAYQSDEEKPVTVSLRIPREVYAQVERYVKMHPGMTLTEFMLDGIRLRLDTPADPRDLILSDDNTILQEVGTQEQRAPESVPAPTKRTRGTMRERILTLLAEHAEGLGAEEIRAYLKPAKPLGDTLRGMRRNGVVKTRGTGKDTRYFVGEEHSDGSPTAPDHEQSGSHCGPH